METSPTITTSSGDGSGKSTPVENDPAGASAANGEGADLLRADGSLIAVTRGEDAAPRREPASRSATRLRLDAWRSRTADRLAAAAPSEIALSAFAAGLVAGVILGVAAARK